MKVVCSWCTKDLGEKEPLNDNSVSHGICKPCAKKMMESIKSDEGR